MKYTALLIIWLRDSFFGSPHETKSGNRVSLMLEQSNVRLSLLDSNGIFFDTSSRGRDPFMENETLTLAPAAGAGIGKKIADVLLARPDFVDDMVAALSNGLKAHRSFYVKDEGLQREPDFKVQLQAAGLIMAHMEGEPVKRIIHQHLGADGKLDLRGALQDSPELAAAVAAELEKAKWRTSGRQAHKRPKKAEAEVPGELTSDPVKPADKF